MNYIPSHEEYLEGKCTRLEDSVDRLMEENRELRSELSALKSATAGDRECAKQAMRIAYDYDKQSDEAWKEFWEIEDERIAHGLPMETKVRDDISIVIAAHTNPIRARLKEAVGLLREVAKWRDHAMTTCVEGDRVAATYSTKQDSAGLCREVFNEIDAYLATIQSNEGVGNG